MTTRYSLPEGVTAITADGVHFDADENGHIDVAGAHPKTVAALVEYGGAKPVPTQEELDAAEAADAERVRFAAVVAEMRAAGQKQAQSVTAAAATAVTEAAAAAAAEEHAKIEASMTERAAGEAAMAAAPVEPVAPPEPLALEDTRAVLPPRRTPAAAKKNG